MATGDFYIEALDHGDTAWRIDWFGHLAFPNHTVRWTRPSLCVAISAVSPDCEVVSGDSHQREVWLSIGLLTVLRVGDIWMGGKLFASPDHELETFPEITIDCNTVTTIKAGVCPEGGEFFLPLRQHPWHVKHTQSFCEIIRLPSGQQIVVPCWELIRFYFGSSANLLDRLVKPDLERGSLYKKKISNPVNGHMYLKLAEGIGKGSASDVARIAGAFEAWRSAARISASCLKAATRAEPIYPHTQFPFEGKTTLTASGKWISRNGAEKATFVVFHLRSCSHPFPFKTLNYRIEDFAIKNITRAVLPSDNRKRNYRFTAPSEKREVRIREQDPGRDTATRLRTKQMRPRFPDLQQKSIWQLSPIAKENAGSTLISPNATQYWNSTGDSVGSSPIRSIDISTYESTSLWGNTNGIPAFVKEALRSLPISPHAKVELLYPNGTNDPTFLVATLSDQDGVIPDSLFVCSKLLEQRLRRAAVLVVTGIDLPLATQEMIVVVEPQSDAAESAIGQIAWPVDRSLSFDQISEYASLLAAWAI